MHQALRLLALGLIITLSLAQTIQKCSHAINPETAPQIKLGYKCEEEFSIIMNQNISLYYEIPINPQIDAFIEVETIEGRAQLKSNHWFDILINHLPSSSSMYHTFQQVQIPRDNLDNLESAGRLLRVAVIALAPDTTVKLTVRGLSHGNRMAQNESKTVQSITDKCCDDTYGCGDFRLHSSAQDVNITVPYISEYELCQRLEKAHCNEKGHLQAAYFQNFNDSQYPPLEMACPFPKEYAKFKDLETLDLQNQNGVTGDIADVLVILSGLSKLRELHLDGTQISGEIPCSIAKQLPKLEVLSMSDTKLKGELPLCLFDIPNLRVLEIENTGLTGSISDLESDTLEVLSLDGNKLDGKLPDWTKLPQLDSLSLRHNRLDGGLTPIPSKMLYLHLTNNSLTGKLPSNVFSTPHLRMLSLSDNKLSGRLPTTASSDSLFDIQLDNNDFDGPVPAQLASLSSLRYLHMAENNLSGSLDKFALQLQKQKTPSLLLLDLSGNQLSGSIPEALDSMNSDFFGRNAIRFLSSIIHLEDNDFTGPVPVPLVKRTMECKVAVGPSWWNYLTGLLLTRGNDVECPSVTELPELGSENKQEGFYYCSEIPQLTNEIVCKDNGRLTSIYNLLAQRAGLPAIALPPSAIEEEADQPDEFYADSEQIPTPNIAPSNVESAAEYDVAEEAKEEEDSGESDEPGAGGEAADRSQTVKDDETKGDEERGVRVDTVQAEEREDSQEEQRGVARDNAAPGDREARGIELVAGEEGPQGSGGKKRGSLATVLTAVLVSLVVIALAAIAGVIFYRDRARRYQRYDNEIDAQAAVASV